VEDRETSVESSELAVGTDVGGYVVEFVLGQGGMGVVYAATHPLIGKRAAVKVLRPELSTDVRAVERFITEARSVNQIGHPNIVDIFAFGTLPDGRNYYVMDLLVGESLRTRIKRTGALHVSEAAHVVDEISSALIAAHSKGIIHRDLKPDNVFMMSAAGRWPEVKLLDWGLAKLLSPTSKFRTVTGALLGTPVYMSPEQARSADTVDVRTDIYSLGVIAYELLSGIAPFKRNTSMETLLAHAEEDVPPLAEKVPGLPDELIQLIEAMLGKEPDERPTLAAVRTVLRRLKGTKIPTMSVAGIAMEIPVTSTPSYSRPGTDELRTLDDENQRTRPPPRSGPIVDPEVTSVDPPSKPIAPTPAMMLPGTHVGPQPRPASHDPNVSAVPLPPPPTTPPPMRDAPMQLATPMPMASHPMIPIQPTGDVGVRFRQPSQMPFVQAMPPMHTPTPIQVRPPTPLPAKKKSRSLMVIAFVALVMIGAGVAFALLQQ
jgi:eukaryotic-like serine/threonine-protein kinase